MFLAFSCFWPNVRPLKLSIRRKAVLSPQGDPRDAVFCHRLPTGSAHPSGVTATHREVPTWLKRLIIA